MYKRQDYLETRADGSELLTDIRADGSLTFSTVAARPKGKPGDVLLSFAPEKAGTEEAERRKAEKRERRTEASNDEQETE